MNQKNNKATSNSRVKNANNSNNFNIGKVNNVKAANKAVNNINSAINNLNNKNQKINNNLNKINKNQNNLLNNAESVLNNSINNLNNLNNNIAKLQENLEASKNNSNSSEPFYVKHKTLLIVLGVIILLIVLYFVGSFVYKKYFKKSTSETQKLFLENALSSEQNNITNLEIVPPRNGFDFSITFWVYVNDLYQYNNTWRHLFHKGPFNTKDVMNFSDWDQLTAVHREQSPGCWLHPDSPTLRYVLTIQPSKEFCGMFKNKGNCEEKTYCNWDGNACNLERLHPKDLYNDKPVDYIDTQEGDTILQYVDIEIPVNEVHHIAFVLDQKNLNVFQNGKLTQSAKFMGSPIFNKNDLHFFAKNNFSGNLLNWTYYPDTISIEKVNSLAKELPNFEKIPKKRLVYNHLKNGKVLNAAKSLF